MFTSVFCKTSVLRKVSPASRFREFETLFSTSKSCKTLIEEFKDFSKYQKIYKQYLDLKT